MSLEGKRNVAIMISTSMIDILEGPGIQRGLEIPNFRLVQGG